jgi:hypothetical protein
MPPELENVESGSAADTPVVPPPAPTPPTETPVDWKAKYDGLKGTWTKEKNRADTLAAQKSQLEQQLEETKLTTETQVVQLTTELGTVKAQATQWETRAQALEKKEALGTTIRTKYASLTDLWDSGLLNLNGIAEDALDAHLEGLASKIGTIADSKQEQRFAGSTPPPPAQGNAPSETVAEAKKAVDAAAKNPTQGFNSPEYHAAMAKLRAAYAVPKS